jgi:hypothetical protein
MFTGNFYKTRSELLKSKGLFLGQSAIRVQFRFCLAWIILSEDSSITTVFTKDGKRLIGYNDAYMITNGLEDNEAFVNALAERASDDFLKQMKA